MIMIRSQKKAKKFNAQWITRIIEITTVASCLLWSIEASAKPDPKLHLGLPLHSLLLNPEIEIRKPLLPFSVLTQNLDLIAPEAVYFGQNSSTSFSNTAQYEFTSWTLFRFQSFQ